jgi:hypothetical protein
VSACGRQTVKPIKIDIGKCNTKDMIEPLKIKSAKYIKGVEVRSIITAYQDCGQYVEKVANLNYRAAILNKPDSFFEDVQEFFMGFGIGSILTAIAVLL